MNQPCRRIRRKLQAVQAGQQVETTFKNMIANTQPSDEQTELTVALALTEEAQDAVFDLLQRDYDSSTLSKANVLLLKAIKQLRRRENHLIPAESQSLF